MNSVKNKVMSRKLIIATVLAAVVALAAEAFAQMGYRRDPWGGSTWTGPGAPPHWSPEGQHRYNSMKQKEGIYPQVRKGYGYHHVKPKHPIHYPRYRHIYPRYKSYFRGSHIYIHAGPGGWYISASGGWGWHDRRRIGHVYYSEPIYSTQYIIVDRPPVEREYRQEPDYVPHREGFTPLQTGKNGCEGAPSITYGANGTLYMSTGKASAGCR